MEGAHCAISVSGLVLNSTQCLSLLSYQAGSLVSNFCIMKAFGVSLPMDLINHVSKIVYSYFYVAVFFLLSWYFPSAIDHKIYFHASQDWINSKDPTFKRVTWLLNQQAVHFLHVKSVKGESINNTLKREPIEENLDDFDDSSGRRGNRLATKGHFEADNRS